MGALSVLACDVAHFVCSTCTYINEEVHCSFFLDWTAKMSTIKKEYILCLMTRQHSRLLLGNTPSEVSLTVWELLIVFTLAGTAVLAKNSNLYTGKEDFPFVAYEVICTARKFIQSVFVGHPGSRNDKHIVKADETVLDFLEGNNWMNSRACRCLGANNNAVTFVGMHLICDGGYHQWPCLVSPVKRGAPGSPTIKWSAKIDSVRKDTEGEVWNSEAPV